MMRVQARVGICLLFLSRFCCVPSNLPAAQETDVRAFGVSDGLPHEIVRDIVKTSDGAIWFATWGGGVARYQGHDWQTFDESDGLPNDSVRCLAVDRKGYMWAGTREGIACYDGRRWFSVAPDIPGLATPSVFCLAERSNGDLWFGCRNETILRWTPDPSAEPDSSAELERPEKGSWSVVLEPAQETPFNVRDIIEMENGEMWVALDVRGIAAWDGDDWNWVLELDDPNQKIFSLEKTSDGVVWAAGGQNLCQFDGGTWRFLERNPVDSVCVDSSPTGDLYVGTREGFWIRRGADWRNPQLDVQIRYQRVECVKCFEDGTVWVGTEHGAYRITPRPWTVYVTTPDGIELIGRSLYADPETPPLVADREGRLLQFDGRAWQPIASIGDGDQHVGQITRPANGRIWIQTQSRVIQFSLSERKTLRSVEIPGECIGDSLFHTREGILYLLSKVGVYELVGDSWEPRPCAPGYDRMEAYSMRQDERGRLWVELENRVECWEGDQIETFFPREEFVTPNRVCALACGDNGRMWFGTNGSGVISWDGDSFCRYTTKDGLLSDVSTVLYEDSCGVLWVGTKYMGLSSYWGGRWVTFASKEGLRGRGAVRIAEHPTGTIWIGIRSVGVACYTPRKGAPDTFVHEFPPTIPYSEPGVFTFSGRDKWKLSTQEDLVFSWRVFPVSAGPEGFEWSPFRRWTTVNTPPLKPGQYTFEVRVADIDRNIDPTPARVRFEVLLPIWRTPQFLLVLLVAGIAVVLLAQKHAALGRSEKKYRDLVESINDVVYTTDKNGGLSYVSPAVYAVSGFSPDELIDESGFDYVHGEDVKTVKNRFSRILTGETVTHEYRIRTKSGQHRWMHDSCRPYVVGNEIVGVAGVLTDIHARKQAEEALQEANEELEERVKKRTRELEEANRVLQQQIIERKQAEEELRKSKEALEESESRFRGIVESTSVGYCHIGRDGLFRYVNDAWLKMHKFSSSDEVVGKHNSIADPPPDQEQINVRIEKLFKEKTILTGEARRLCKDGSIGYHTYSANPVIRDGEVVGLDGFLIDTTERRKAEEALQQSEERFRAQYKAIPVPTFTWQGSGDDLVLVDYNHAAEKITKGRIINYVGMSAREFYGPDFPNIIGNLMRCFREHTTIQEETCYRLRTTDEKKYFAVTYVFVPPDLVAVHAEDITERKNAEEQIHALTHQLIKSQEDERLRISRDLHDNVAQNLSTVKIRLDSLANNHVQLPPDVTNDIGELSRTLQKSISAVRDLSYDLRPSGLDQLGLVHTLYQFCDEFSAENGIAVDFHSAGMERLNVDLDTKINLYRLIQEALNNVRWHAEANRVAVRLVASHPKIILRIEDDGKGFNVQEKLSALYHSKRMGLRSMEERVNLLDGRIDIRSRPGEGTRIMVEVPYKEENREKEDDDIRG